MKIPDKILTTGKNRIFTGNRVYLWLAVPLAFAACALAFHDFGFKAAVTGSCMALLILAAIFTGRSLWKIGLILVAFLLSIGGDWFLSHRHGEIFRFISGIALFFLAHTGYLLYALQRGTLHYRILGVVLLVYLVFFFGWLSPAIDHFALTTAVFLYLVISCVSLGAAAGIETLPRTAKVFFVGGILLILFSDTLIALKEFLACGEWAFLILPTYYLSHIFITVALLNSMIQAYQAFILRRKL